VRLRIIPADALVTAENCIAVIDNLPLLEVQHFEHPQFESIAEKQVALNGGCQRAGAVQVERRGYDLWMILNHAIEECFIFGAGWEGHRRCLCQLQNWFDWLDCNDARMRCRAQFGSAFARKQLE